jgi:hypothetical protein
MTTSLGGMTKASIVEGHGEVAALPLLLRRIAIELSVWNFTAPAPHRINRGSLLAAGGIENAVQAQAFRVRGPGGVLVFIDADDDCPATLGPELMARSRAARSDIKVSVVLANREFEAWFLAAAPSLSGRRGLSDGLLAPEAPEGVRGAKEWLTERMVGHPYRPTADQAALVEAFDMGLARRCAPSFDKFYRDVTWLLGA